MLDLELDIAKGYRHELVRPLTGADLESRESAAAPKISVLKRISDRHHALARYLALGSKNIDAAAHLGYSRTTVSALKSDPTFRDLIEFYRSDDQREMRGIAERLAGISSDALDLLEERLNDDVERTKLPTKIVMEIATLGADRVGFGPASTSTQVNIHVGLAEKLERARRRAAEALSPPPMIEGAVNGT